MLLKTLPGFEALNSNGNITRSEDFQGKILYVQFVDTGNADDIDLIESVYHNWSDSNLAFLVISPQSEKFRQYVAIEVDERITLSSEYKKFKTIFQAPECCETFYLFDPAGKLVKTGTNSSGYEKGIKTELNRLLKNKVFTISNFIAENENLKNLYWLAQCRQIVEKEGKDGKNYVIFCLLRSVCDTCFSGLLVQRLNQLQERCQNRARVISIVPMDFSDTDIENLQQFLGVKFQVQRADPALEEMWKSQIDEFRETDLTNILFLVDQNGTVVKVAGNDPVYIQEFFIYTDSLVREGE